MFEKHLPLFVVFFHIDTLIFSFKQTEDYLGRVSVGDREFLINPQYGAAVKQPLSNTQGNLIPPKSSLKKPFDWMSDEQYNNLLVSKYYIVFSRKLLPLINNTRNVSHKLLGKTLLPQLSQYRIFYIILSRLVFKYVFLLYLPMFNGISIMLTSLIQTVMKYSFQFIKKIQKVLLKKVACSRDNTD